jgi:ABC-2 type transport system permease protein
MTALAPPLATETEYVPRRGSLAIESLLFARRLLTHWRREPVIPIQALVYPIFLLITYDLLVGKSIERITGTPSIYGLVPTCAVTGAFFGSLAASFSIRAERDNGLLSRFWTLPVHRGSALTGRLLAEAARTLLGSIVITAVGVGLGLRFAGGWLTVILFILVPVVVGVVFSTALTAIAVRSQSNTMLILLGVPAVAAVFASSGSPPISMLPGWMQPIVQFQPMAATIEGMRALAEGRPAVWPLLLTLIWTVGLAALVVPLAIRGYRAAAESGR